MYELATIEMLLGVSPHLQDCLKTKDNKQINAIQTAVSVVEEELGFTILNEVADSTLAPVELTAKGRILISLLKREISEK